MAVVHHSAICTRDVDTSLRFWRDGLGFQVLMDHRFEGDWPHLLRSRSNSLRAIFLGEPDTPQSGIVELVDLGAASEHPGVADPPHAGVLLLSVFTDVDAAIARLTELDLADDVRRIEVHGVAMATVVDPNGVVVELVGSAAAANLEQM